MKVRSEVLTYGLPKSPSVISACPRAFQPANGEWVDNIWALHENMSTIANH